MPSVEEIVWHWILMSSLTSLGLVVFRNVGCTFKGWKLGCNFPVNVAFGLWYSYEEIVLEWKIQTFESL